MSGFLFLLGHWLGVMSRTTEGRSDRRTGIRWKRFTSVSEDLDFADDIALLSSRYVDIRNKTSRLVEKECQKRPKDRSK